MNKDGWVRLVFLAIFCFINLSLVDFKSSRLSTYRLVQIIGATSHGLRSVIQDSKKEFSMCDHSKRVLFIVTSNDRIGPNDRATGYEYSEVAHPYLCFTADGISVDFASLKGGFPPETGYDDSDIASVIFRNSNGFRRLNKSMLLSDVDLNNYDAIFFPGGLGPMVDMEKDMSVKKAIAQVYEEGRIVGAVCHGPVALLNVDLSDGSSFLEGKNIACFTKAEEEAYAKSDVPFILDTALTAQGARHTYADLFEAHVVVDGRLVTGQNPASAAGVAVEIIKML